MAPFLNLDDEQKEELGSGLMLGGSALGAFGALEQGAESERQFKFSAKARGRQAVGVGHEIDRLGVVGGQKLGDLIREEGENLGTLKSIAAGSGVEGGGVRGTSITTQRKKLSGRYREARQRLGEEIGFAKGSLERRREELLREQRELRRRGRRARTASYWRAATSLVPGASLFFGGGGDRPPSTFVPN